MLLVTIYPVMAYEENFDKGEAKGWKPVTGSWNVKNKEYFCTVGADNDYTFFEESVGNKSWIDYTFTVNIMPISASNYAGVLFRVIETGKGGPHPGWSTGKFYYWLIGIGNGSPGYSVIWKAMGGPEANIEGTNGNTLKSGEWNEVKVEVTGSDKPNMKLYLNGKLQKDFTDSSQPHGYGGIGLAGFISEVHFDNVKVEGQGIPGSAVSSYGKLALTWGYVKFVNR